jgi:hypothetical protein
VERWFALLTEKQLRRGVHRSTREMENAIHEYIHHNNRDPKPFVWHKTADQILDSVAHFCVRTLETGHQLARVFWCRTKDHGHAPLIECDAVTIGADLGEQFVPSRIEFVGGRDCVFREHVRSFRGV